MIDRVKQHILISVRDFLPKLCVFSNSTSVRCTQITDIMNCFVFKQLAERTVNSCHQQDVIKIDQLRFSSNFVDEHLANQQRHLVGSAKIVAARRTLPPGLIVPFVSSSMTNDLSQFVVQHAACTLCYNTINRL